MNVKRAEESLAFDKANCRDSETTGAGPLPAGFRRYTNWRFGFSVGYPVSFQAQPEPQNGDGCRFIAANGAYISAAGGNLHEGHSLAAEYSAALAGCKGTVDFRQLGLSDFVIGWSTDVEISFLKVVAGSRSRNSLKIVFPTGAWDEEILTNVIKTFQPGDRERAW